VKKSSRIQLAREIISRVKSEMSELRMTESDRNSLRTKVAPYSNETVIRLEQA
jgi:hypothetical protein